jgi:hypothetical protein
MTATTVDGRAVIATEKVETGLSKPGKPVYFTRILRLLLDDGSDVHGCTECDFTAPEWTSVRPHLGSHNGSYNGGRARKQKTAPPADVMALSLAELVDRALRADVQFDVVMKIQEDRDHWKTRAKDAEKRLSTLRNALGAT